MAATNDATIMGDVECPSTLFARGLKTYETRSFVGSDGTTSSARMVVGFDEEKFKATCLRSSPDYNSLLCNFDAIAKELVKVGEIWENRDLLDGAMKRLATLHGWTQRKEKKSIKCNRYGETDTSRNYVGGELKVGCTFKVDLAALIKQRYKAKEESTKWVYRDIWSGPVEIKKANCNHGGACTPGKQNLIATSQRAGKYIDGMPTSILYSLCNFAEKDGKLSSSLIKKVIGPIWPKNKVISKSNVFYIRVKVMRSLKAFNSTNGDYEEFKQMVNASDLLSGIDNEVSLDDDEAVEMAQSLWAEVMSDVDKDEVLFSFIDYLELISVRAKGFVYKLAEDKTKFGPKRVVGVMWQTATMRNNFELFGDVIGLDMMKRGLNKLLWPYAGVAMYDDMQQLCLACEGVLCGERTDMYKFIADFLATSTPLRTLADVKIVAGDGFFDQELVEKLGFSNATFILDRWHLLDSGLEKMFGKSGYEKLKGHLVRMIESNSKEDFDSFFTAAWGLLKSMEQRDGQLETTLLKFGDMRKNYASYCIASIPGNRGFLGNANSEQNHSSALVFLNDGDRGKNKYCQHLVTLIKDLLRREQWRRNKSNELIFKLNQELSIEVSRLRRAPQTETNKDLITAADTLNHNAFVRYKKHRLRADEDLRVTHDIDPSTQETIIKVSSVKHPDASPRIFHNLSDRCKCLDRLKEDDMCAHEIKVIGGFDASRFKRCHMKRTCVETSLNGWVPPTTNQIDSIIGYEAEPSEQDDGNDLLVGTPEDGIMRNFENAAAASNNELESAAAAPPPSFNCFPEKTGKCKPLETKTVKHILAVASAAYGRMDETLKFEVSALALRIEELMTLDPNKSRTVTSRGGYSIRQPNNSVIASQPKARLMSQAEKHSSNASKKISAAIQNMGVKQTVIGNGEFEVEVNGKSVSHCGFCKEELHAFTNCPSRESLNMRAQEYILSSDSKFVHNQQSLRSRIGSMTHSFTQDGERLSHLGNLDQLHIRSNFIIHKASMMDNKVYYNVSFLNEHAQSGEKNWISWDAMNTLITHSMKKKKFVFDETILHEPGWVSQHDGAINSAHLGSGKSVSNDRNTVLSLADTSKRKSPPYSSVVADGKPHQEQEVSKPSTPKRLFRS